MLTKTHFESVAGIIAVAIVAAEERAGDSAAVQLVAGKLADYFATTNPQFSRQRFLAACGIDAGTAVVEVGK